MSARMSAEELREHLIRGSDLPTPVTLAGFVEVGDEGYLSFSPGADCETWIPLPLSLVLEAVPLGTQRCKDHRHNLVRLELGTSDEPEVNALQALVRVVGHEGYGQKEQHLRLLSRLKEFQSTTPRALPQVDCDTIGDLVICTAGDNVCWWSPRSGYHCN
jgi:hypothetical protein